MLLLPEELQQLYSPSQFVNMVPMTSWPKETLGVVGHRDKLYFLPYTCNTMHHTNALRVKSVAFKRSGMRIPAADSDVTSGKHLYGTRRTLLKQTLIASSPG